MRSRNSRRQPSPCSLSAREEGSQTHRSDGETQLDHLDLLLGVLAPHPHRPVVARARDQALRRPTPLPVDAVDHARVPLEPPQDLARLEVKEEDGVVGAAGDEGRRRAERDRGRDALARFQLAKAAGARSVGQLLQH